jgi:hypothetical protein
LQQLTKSSKNRIRVTRGRKEKKEDDGVVRHVKEYKFRSGRKELEGRKNERGRGKREAQLQQNAELLEDGLILPRSQLPPVGSNYDIVMAVKLHAAHECGWCQVAVACNLGVHTGDLLSRQGMDT